MIIATWNVENLFRPNGASGPRDRATYDAKLDALAETIHALDPGLLGVQEVGDPEALEDLVKRLDGHWHTALSRHPDGRGIRVGFLSRHPITVLADTVTFPDQLRPVQADDTADATGAMGRGALAVRIEPTPARPLEAVVCHLKSKLLTYPGPRFQPRDEGERARYGAYALFRRAAEATTVRVLADQLLDGHGRDRAVIVLGDLNDEVAAATTQILHGPPGSQIDTPGHDRPDKGDAARLFNLAPRIPADQRFSRIHTGHGELIDHILVSHALLNRVERAGTGTPAQKAAPALPSITDTPTERRDAPASDHSPVWAQLTP